MVVAVVDFAAADVVGRDHQYWHALVVSVAVDGDSEAADSDARR